MITQYPENAIVGDALDQMMNAVTFQQTASGQPPSIVNGEQKGHVIEEYVAANPVESKPSVTPDAPAAPALTQIADVLKM